MLTSKGNKPGPAACTVALKVNPDATNVLAHHFIQLSWVEGPFSVAQALKCLHKNSTQNLLESGIYSVQKKKVSQSKKSTKVQALQIKTVEKRDTLKWTFTIGSPLQFYV